MLGARPGGCRWRECTACSRIKYVSPFLLIIFGATTIAAKNGYQDSLAVLVDETTKNIQTYVKDEAALYIATIAQRVNISLKVALTIA